MREESKLRKQDEKAADIVADFLDKTFYKEETNDFIRNVEKTLQVYGIDTIFTYQGKKYKCDEKTPSKSIILFSSIAIIYSKSYSTPLTKHGICKTIKFALVYMANNNLAAILILAISSTSTPFDARYS